METIEGMRGIYDEDILYYKDVEVIVPEVLKTKER